MRQKLFLFLFIFLISQLSRAQSSTIENTDNTITVSGTWGCLPMGGPYNGPTASGNYIVTVNWFDFQFNPQSYQSLLAPTGDLINISNYGIPGLQTIVINAQNNPGFSKQGPEPADHFFPNDDPNNPDDEGYALKDIGDITSITIKTLDLSTTWIIEFQNGVQINCTVLPVYVEYLTGQDIDGNAFLTWSTVNENQSGITRFEVERTQGTTGSFWTWQWQKIATLNSFNSTSVQNYNYTDLYPANTQTYYYYRVKAYRGNYLADWDFVYIANLANTTQPGPISCNYFMIGLEGLCTNSTAFYSLNDNPDYANIAWTATPFYAIANSYKFTVKETNLTRLMVIKPNVITLTATVNRCSSGGTIVKYIYKGKPPVKLTSTSQVTTNSCNGFITSSTKTITVTPFPGTSANDYQWYLDNVYIGSGLLNNFTNTTGIQKNCEVRFNGPCGISIGKDSIAGITCLPSTIPTTSTSTVVTDPCTGIITASSIKIIVSPFSCSVGTDYQWYINGYYSGTGLSRTFNTLNNPTINYEIRFNGPCGLSTASGTIWGSGPILVDFAKIAPNPITGNLRIDSRRPPCDPSPAPFKTIIDYTKVNMITSYEIYDYLGNRVKSENLKIPLDLIDINVQNLKRGNYRLVIHYGDFKEDKQIKLVD